MTAIKNTHKYFSITSGIMILFLHLTISISANSVQAPYTPPDNIALNCGSFADSKSQDGRNWSGDMGSKFGPHAQSNNTTVQAVRALNQASSVENVPYMTARISRSQFTYMFRVTAGPKFIRLYFYPALYSGFEKSTAAFSVKAGPYMLLSDFSPSSTGAALGLNSFVKEFCINVQENQQQLNITFAPSATTASDDVYVFINGIEIVSMPTDHLYYTRSDQDLGVPLIGQRYLYNIANSTVLEMFYRLNVGGRSLLPIQDSGMFRRWSNDGEYLMNPGVLPVNTSITIKYTDHTPPYIAPVEIYTTGRSMGPNATDNYEKNTTWFLPVDAGCWYFVRLHFCEFQIEIKRDNDRVFQIYINSYIAEHQADVIAWSGGNGIPVYRDYVVMMETGKRYLVIALHPTAETKALYADAILNGVEVFKLKHYNDGNLPRQPINPQPAVFAPTANKSKTTNNPILMFIAIGGSLMVMLAILIPVRCTVFSRLKNEGTRFL